MEKSLIGNNDVDLGFGLDIPNNDDDLLDPQGDLEQEVEQDTPDVDEPEGNTNDTQVDAPDAQLDSVEDTMNFLSDNGFIDIPEDHDGEFTDEDIQQLVIDKVRPQIDDEHKENLVKVLQDLDTKTGGRVTHALNGGTMDNFNPSAYTEVYTSYDGDNLTSAQEEQVVREYYKRHTKYSKEEIDEEVDGHKDLDEMSKRAKKWLPKVKKWEQAEKQSAADKTTRDKEASAKAAKDFETNLHKEIDKSKEFAGVNVTPKFRASIKKNIADGKTMAKINKDLVKYMPTLIALDELGVLDNDMSKITARLESNRVRQSRKGTGTPRGRKGSTKQGKKPVGNLDIQALVDNIGKY